MSLTQHECFNLCREIEEIINEHLGDIARTKDDDPPGWRETIYEAMDGATTIFNLTQAICDRLQDMADETQPPRPTISVKRL